jgi:hypothetical protein
MIDGVGGHFRKTRHFPIHSRLGSGREYGTVNPMEVLFSILSSFQYVCQNLKKKNRRTENDFLRLNWRESGTE